jgi:hypothetical protein
MKASGHVKVLATLVNLVGWPSPGAGTEVFGKRFLRRNRCGAGSEYLDTVTGSMPYPQMQITNSG